MAILKFIQKTFGLDYRSLALYRMLMGLIVMSDVIYRLPDLTNFYTDIGLVPRATFMSEMTMPWSFSFHFANGSFGFAAAMFALHLIFGIMLVFGYKTRWAMLGAFIMTTSVHNRNWLVNNGGDDVLRAILFISIFLPLNRYFSLDSALTDKTETKKDEHFSTWGLAFFLQVFAIYFVSFLLKDHPIWRTDFTAVFYSLRLDIFATPIAVWMRDYPALGKFSTLFTIYVEWLGPILLVGAFVFGKFWWMARLFTVIIFWGLHIGIISTMWIGVFPYTCLAMWTIFIPGPVWDKIFSYLRNGYYDKVSIFYDGECGFCKKMVYILREFFLLSETKIAPTQENKELQALMKKENSWIFVNVKGDKSFHFYGIVDLMRHSPILRWVAPLFALKPVVMVGNGIYKWIANNRMKMGKVTQYFEFHSPKKSISFFSWLYQTAGAYFFITLLMWNLTTIKKWGIEAPTFQNVTRWLHLYQEWNMFAPFPKMDNIWIEIPAVLGDGTEMELLTGDTDIYSPKDKTFPALVPNEHWRKFYLNVSERVDYARYYGGYLCREWNERNIRKKPETSLRKFEIVVYSQMNLPNGDKGGISRKLSWKHWCFDEDFKRESGKTE